MTLVFNHLKTEILSEDIFNGTYTVILGAVTSGKNAIVGAIFVISKSIPTNVIVFSNPAIIKKKLA